MPADAMQILTALADDLLAAMAEGDAVTTLLGAGNRDPRRFAEPGTFGPLRSGGGPLGLGGGAHFCIGAALARLEAAVTFPRLLRWFPRIAPAGAPGHLLTARL